MEQQTISIAKAGIKARNRMWRQPLRIRHWKPLENHHLGSVDLTGSIRVGDAQCTRLHPGSRQSSGWTVRLQAMSVLPILPVLTARF